MRDDDNDDDVLSVVISTLEEQQQRQVQLEQLQSAGQGKVIFIMHTSLFN